MGYPKSITNIIHVFLTQCVSISGKRTHISISCYWRWCLGPRPKGRHRCWSAEINRLALQWKNYSVLSHEHSWWCSGYGSHLALWRSRVRIPVRLKIIYCWQLFVFLTAPQSIGWRTLSFGEERAWRDGKKSGIQGILVLIFDSGSE